MARNRLEIDLDLIRQNYGIISNAVNPMKTMAVLKADGYGLGAQKILKILLEQGCDKFGVADFEEAIAIEGNTHDTYILGDILKEEARGIVENNIVAPITSFEKAEFLNIEAGLQNKKVKVHFLIDTGMGRLGIPVTVAVEVIQRCVELENLDVVGIYSHFPFAYGDEEFSDKQVSLFKGLLEALAREDISFKEIHMANSDGIHNIYSSKTEPFNMVRSGINLYGCFDLEGKKTLELKQVLNLKSRLVSIRKLPAGSSIGYGRTCILDKDTLLGTVAIGYADGLPISLSNSGYLIVRGVKCPILGRVSMDYTTVDLSAVPNAECGDEVICLNDDIPVSGWAVSAETITYDIICSIGNRVKRVYINE